MIKRSLIYINSALMGLMLTCSFVVIGLYLSFNILYPIQDSSLSWLIERWNPQSYYFGLVSLKNAFTGLGAMWQVPTELLSKSIVNPMQSFGDNAFANWLNVCHQAMDNYSISFNNLINSTQPHALEEYVQFIYNIFAVVLGIFATPFVCFLLIFTYALSFVLYTFFYYFISIYCVCKWVVMLLLGFYNTPFRSGTEYQIPDWREVWDFSKTFVLVTL